MPRFGMSARLAQGDELGAKNGPLGAEWFVLNTRAGKVVFMGDDAKALRTQYSCLTSKHSDGLPTCGAEGFVRAPKRLFTAAETAMCAAGIMKPGDKIEDFVLES